VLFTVGYKSRHVIVNPSRIDTGRDTKCDTKADLNAYSRIRLPFPSLKLINSRAFLFVLPLNSSEDSMASASPYDEFDYIVVGAGIGGLVVASRLGEHINKSVLLIEAGPDCIEDPRIKTPGLVTTLYDDAEIDWSFMSEPQRHIHGRQIPQPRGRVVGGSSALNFTMIMYPSNRGFEAWKELGNEGWGAQSMAPYIRRFHTYTAPDPAVAEQLAVDHYLDPSQRGSTGPLPVAFPATYGPFNHAWDETFASLGWPNADDPFPDNRFVAFTCPLSVDAETSIRGTAGAYHIDRPNISLLTETRVERILFSPYDGSNRRPTATGVQINVTGGRKVASAKREVILCAGSLQSPQLLEISGIGDADLLRKHGIPVIVDLPGVGENLQDHCISSVSYKVADDQVSGDTMRDPQMVQSAMEMYHKMRTGPLAGMPMSVANLPLVDGRERASMEDRDHIIDTYLHNSLTANGGLCQGTQVQSKMLSQMLRDGTEAIAEYIYLPLQLHANPGTTSMADLLEKKADGNYISILAMLCHPFSRGSVHIKSSNIEEKPVYDPNYLSHSLDLEILARHTQYIDKIARSAPLVSLLQPDVRIPDVSTIPDLSNLDAARCAVKDRLLSCFHPAGSCSMMPIELGGVVDDHLRVHGTNNLRVVDASIFPVEPSSTIQASVYAVAERAVDLIREDFD
jgi:choline dehydrogenase-like flavoprotein